MVDKRAMFSALTQPTAEALARHLGAQHCLRCHAALAGPWQAHEWQQVQHTVCSQCKARHMVLLRFGRDGHVTRSDVSIAPLHKVG